MYARVYMRLWLKTYNWQHCSGYHFPFPTYHFVWRSSPIHCYLSVQWAKRPVIDFHPGRCFRTWDTKPHLMSGFSYYSMLWLKTSSDHDKERGTKPDPERRFKRFRFFLLLFLNSVLIFPNLLRENAPSENWPSYQFYLYFLTLSKCRLYMRWHIFFVHRHESVWLCTKLHLFNKVLNCSL